MALRDELIDQFVVVALEVAESQLYALLVDGLELGYRLLFPVPFSHHRELPGHQVFLGNEVVS